MKQVKHFGFKYFNSQIYIGVVILYIVQGETELSFRLISSLTQSHTKPLNFQNPKRKSTVNPHSNRKRIKVEEGKRKKKKYIVSGVMMA